MLGRRESHIWVRIMLGWRASLQAGNGGRIEGLFLSGRGSISCVAQTQVSGLEWCSYQGSSISLLIGGLRVGDNGSCYLVLGPLFLFLPP